MSKHFIFDLGNVLVNFDVQQLYRAVAESSGLPLEESARGLQDGEMLFSVETGKITDQEFVDYVNESKGLHWTLEDLIEVWAGMFSVNEAGYAIFTELKEEGYPVHFLSNLAWHNMEAIRRQWPGFFDQSAENFFSYEMGFHKPDERIYRATLEQLNAEAADCFFLDDKLENVEAARALGMNAHPFSSETVPLVMKNIQLFLEE